MRNRASCDGIAQLFGPVELIVINRKICGKDTSDLTLGSPHLKGTPARKATGEDADYGKAGGRTNATARGGGALRPKTQIGAAVDAVS